MTYVPVPTSAAQQQMEQKGLPQWAIETFIAYAEDQRNHKADFVSNDVAEILAKPARGVEAFFKEYVGLFK